VNSTPDKRSAHRKSRLNTQASPHSDAKCILDVRKDERAAPAYRRLRRVYRYTDSWSRRHAIAAARALPIEPLGCPATRKETRIVLLQ